MATEQQVGAVLKKLTEAYPSFKLSKETAKLYVEFLTDVSPKRLEQGARECIRACKYLPTIAEIRGAAFSWHEPAHEELERLLRQMHEGDNGKQ